MKRTTRNRVLDVLKKESKWNVIDLGCGDRAGCEFANVLVDVYDWSKNYPDKKFIVHDVNDAPLPFRDKEFDFCFASHILEHVIDPISFIKEMSRISNRGYIEVPVPLSDNLVSGNDWVREDINGGCFMMM